VGNLHVRFLGEELIARSTPYPTYRFPLITGSGLQNAVEAILVRLWGIFAVVATALHASNFAAGLLIGLGG
jgi:hypothetical protein